MHNFLFDTKDDSSDKLNTDTDDKKPRIFLCFLNNMIDEDIMIILNNKMSFLLYANIIDYMNVGNKEQKHVSINRRKRLKAVDKRGKIKRKSSRRGENRKRFLLRGAPYQQYRYISQYN